MSVIYPGSSINIHPGSSLNFDGADLQRSEEEEIHQEDIKQQQEVQCQCNFQLCTLFFLLLIVCLLTYACACLLPTDLCVLPHSSPQVLLMSATSLLAMHSCLVLI